MSSDTSNVSRLLLIFIKQPDTDIAIEEVHASLYPEDNESRTPREMQQRIAPYITRANRNIEGNGGTRRIVPGQLKRTYRLIDTAAVTA